MAEAVRSASRQEQGKRRAPRTAWKPGQSGNPSGRPREVGDVRDLARQHTAEAIRTLIEVMRHGKPDRARAAAAEAILDRGWGRPLQPAEVTGLDGVPLQDIHMLQQIRAMTDAERDDFMQRHIAAYQARRLSSDNGKGEGGEGG